MSRAIMRTLAAATALTVACVLAACAGSPESEATEVGQPSEEAAYEANATALQRELKVGLVTNEAGLAPQSLNAAAHRGLQQAAADVDAAVSTVESRSSDDFLPSLEQLGERGFDLVITVGPTMAESTRMAAAKYPDVHFAIVDYDYPPDDRLPNLESLLFNEREAGYLAGYLAGLVSETEALATITASGDTSASYYSRGFEQGAKAAQPTIRVYAITAPAAIDPSGCAELVQQQIARKVDVIFPAGGICAVAALEAAKQADIWAIGADVDRSSLGSFVLTSALKRADVAVLDTVHAAEQGMVEDALGTMSPYRLHGGSEIIYGLSYGGVGIAPVGASVSPETLARVDEVAEDIAEGRLELPRSNA